MVDYDLPMIETDLQELRSKNFLFEDSDRNELVKYMDMINDAAPRSKIGLDMGSVALLVAKIQALARGFLTRQQLAKTHGSDSWRKMQEK